MKKFCLAVILTILSTTPTLAAVCTSSNAIIKVENQKIGVREVVDFYIRTPFAGVFMVTAAPNGNFIQDGSGNPVSVAGNRWTDVKFRNMNWMCSSSTIFSLPKPIVKDIKNIGQFEGQIEYVIGRRNGHYLGQTMTTAGSMKRLRLKFGP